MRFDPVLQWLVRFGCTAGVNIIFPARARGLAASFATMQECTA